MGKISEDFNPDAYAPVADRIRLFYQEYPAGRIRTVLVSRTEREVVFEARVYRGAEDSEPAATGWAAEREGDGDINTVACLENTETSAIGRALANLGFTASRQRPSAEEMAKASRARMRLPAAVPRHRDVSEKTTRHELPTSESEQRRSIDADALQRQANQLADTLNLIRVAERLGLRSLRAQALRARIMASGVTPKTRNGLESVLRRWIEKRRSDVTAYRRPL
jgi:hypothetical protein